MIVSEAPPKRAATVAAAAAVYVVLIASLVLLCAAFAVHLAGVPDDVRQTSQRTGLVLTGFGDLKFYERDTLTILLSLVTLVLMIRALRRIWRGGSDGRTYALILAGVLAVGCLIFNRAGGPNLTFNGTVDGPFYPIYVPIEARATPVWASDVLLASYIAIPLTALCFAILILLPTSTEYFRAMRRSGTY